MATDAPHVLADPMLRQGVMAVLLDRLHKY